MAFASRLTTRVCEGCKLLGAVLIMPKLMHTVIGLRSLGVDPVEAALASGGVVPQLDGIRKCCKHSRAEAGRQYMLRFRPYLHSVFLYIAWISIH